MVAFAKQNAHYRKVPPAGLDPSVPLQLAFNPGERKFFSLKYEQIIKQPRTGRHIREFIFVDQFGNQWVTFLSWCIDDEIHQWPTDRNAYIKPSMILKHGGRVSADLLDKFREAAFTIFHRQDVALKAARHAAGTGGKIVLIDMPPPPELMGKPKTVQLGNPEAHK